MNKITLKLNSIFKNAKWEYGTLNRDFNYWNEMRIFSTDTLKKHMDEVAPRYRKELKEEIIFRELEGE